MWGEIKIWNGRHADYRIEDFDIGEMLEIEDCKLYKYVQYKNVTTMYINYFMCVGIAINPVINGNYEEQMMPNFKEILKRYCIECIHKIKYDILILADDYHFNVIKYPRVKSSINKLNDLLKQLDLWESKFAIMRINIGSFYHFYD